MKDNYPYISSGTWSLLGVKTARPIINARSEDTNYSNEGGVGYNRYQKNIMGMWLIQESKRQWEREGAVLSFNDLEQAARSSEPFASFIDPDYEEFQTPGNMPERIREYCRKTGQKVPETKGEVIRCIAESLAFKYRSTVEGMEEVTGNTYNVINIVGGGIKDKMICQFSANATKRTVSAGPVEATSIGNVIVQAIASGAVKNLQEGREIVRRSFDIAEYTPADSEEWDKAYETWKKIVNK